MDREQGNNIRLYSGKLRELLEKEAILSLKEINNLKEQYNLSDDEIDRINLSAETSYNQALNSFELGEWDKSLTLIEDAYYKAPESIESLILYVKIITEARKLLGNDFNDKSNLQLILKRIEKLDRKKFRQLKKNSSDKRVKPSLKWLLLLIIPVSFFLFFKLHTSSKTITPETTPVLPSDGIVIEKRVIKHSSQAGITVVSSEMKRDIDSFIYTLDFYISSEIENISAISGTVKIIDRNESEIFRQNFKSKESIEYYKGEKIPFSFKIKSLRSSPSIKRVEIVVDSILSTKGTDRDESEPIDLLLPPDKSWNLKISQISSLKTSGVVSDYLTLSFAIENLDSRNISILKGNIEWVDEYNIVVYSRKINFITKNDVPVDRENMRIIRKTMEIGEITSEYRVVIEEIE